MSSCCGSRRSRQGGETAPLLPRDEAETDLQQRVKQKLHTYEMLRALKEGYMPSTEQAVANLRAALASGVLNPDMEDLSDAGRQVVRDCKLWLRTFIELLQEKNDRDQLQEFLWHLSKSRASLDTSELASQASRAKAQADTKAGKSAWTTMPVYECLDADLLQLMTVSAPWATSCSRMPTSASLSTTWRQLDVGYLRTPASLFQKLPRRPEKK